jgi:hypothetical protein
MYDLCICISVQVLKERAESDLKKAADNHWSDGALEVCTSSSYLLQFICHINLKDIFCFKGVAILPIMSACCFYIAVELMLILCIINLPPGRSTAS